VSSRSILLHLGLLILSLAVAWITFRGQLAGDATSDEEGVLLLQAAEGDVERVVYESTGGSLRLEARRDERGRWFEGSEIDAGGEGQEPKTEIFRGGATAEDLWHQLEPLRAKRVLGQVAGEKLQELALADTTVSLTLTVRGRDHRFDLGGEAFGSSDRYAKETDGRVVVLPASLTRDLDTGRSRLMERRLIRATRPEVEALALSRLGRTARIVQHSGTQSAGAFWSLAGEETASGQFQTWVDKFFRLQAVGYRAGEPGGDWQSEATITVESREHGLETLEIWSAAEEGARVWLGRSAHSRLIAELGSPLAEEVCEDLDSLVP
jgi:hypothetical protein